MRDLIDRQAAIDANDAAFWETKNKKHYTKLKMLQSHAFLVETALKDLPSAQPETPCYLGSPCEYQNPDAKMPSVQPEIIRCKDCKRKYLENMVWNCPFGLPGGELFFCAYGAERRTDEQRRNY